MSERDNIFSFLHMLDTRNPAVKMLAVSIYSMTCIWDFADSNSDSLTQSFAELA